MALRILVVEDEMTIALMMEEMLTDLGHVVVELPMRLAPALAAAQTAAIDFAFLDINLDGVKSYPVAEVLRDRGIPFVFATGYGASGVDPAFADRRVLQKPFDRAELAAEIARLGQPPHTDHTPCSYRP